MSDGMLSITGYGDFKRLTKAYDDLEKKNQKLQTDLRKTGQQSKKNDDDMERSMGRWGQRVASIVTSYATLSTAINQINKALQKQIELQNTANQSTMSVADATTSLAVNVGPRVSDARFRQIVERGKSLGRKGFGEADALSAIGQMFSATEGAVDDARINRVMRVFELSERMFRAPEKREGLGSFGGAALDVMKGIPGMTPDQAVSLMVGIQSQARITDVANLKNIVPSIVAAQVARPQAPAWKNAMQQAAIVAALSGRIGDDTGELSRTASANLTAVVSNMAPQYGNLPIMEALREIQKDPKLRDSIKKELRGRIFTKLAQSEFLNESGANDAISFLMSESILNEISPTENEMARFQQRLVSGTDDVRRASTIRNASVNQQSRIRQQYADRGATYAMMFGGEIGDETVPGVFSSTIRPFGRGGFSDTEAYALAWWAYWIKRAQGADEGAATQQAFATFMDRGNLGLLDPALSDSQRTQLTEEMGRINQILSGNSIQARVLEQIEKNRVTEQQKAINTRAALQAAGAAAQARVHQE